jgi:hypothetical protein
VNHVVTKSTLSTRKKCKSLTDVLVLLQLTLPMQVPRLNLNLLLPSVVPKDRNDVDIRIIQGRMIRFLGKDLTELGIILFVWFEQLRERCGGVGGEIGYEVYVFGWNGGESRGGGGCSHDGRALRLERKNGRGGIGRTVLSKDKLMGMFEIVVVRICYCKCFVREPAMSCGKEQRETQRSYAKR